MYYLDSTPGSYDIIVVLIVAEIVFKTIGKTLASPPP